MLAALPGESTLLVEIMARLLRQVGAVQRPDVLRLHVGYAVVTLEGAFDNERGILGYDEAEPFENGGIDDGIGHAGFIFEGQEDNAFSGSGPLAADHRTAHFNPGAILTQGKFVGPPQFGENGGGGISWGGRRW